MTEKVNTWIEKFKNPAYIIMIIGVLYTVSVTYSKVGETVEDQIEINKELKAVHVEFDAFKLEAMERLHAIELSVKNEEIARLKERIETLKFDN